MVWVRKELKPEKIQKGGGRGLACWVTETVVFSLGLIGLGYTGDGVMDGDEVECEVQGKLLRT